MMDSGRDVISVLSDGTFLNVETTEKRLVLSRSRDQVQTWKTLEKLPGMGTYPQVGPITQLRDGNLVWPIGFAQPGLPHAIRVFRSTDGGHTWSKVYPVGPTGEPAIIKLQSGKLLAVIRNNLMPAPSAWRAYWEAGGQPWLFWKRFAGYTLAHYRNHVTSVHKNCWPSRKTAAQPGSTSAREATIWTRCMARPFSSPMEGSLSCTCTVFPGSAEGNGPR